MTTTTAVKEKRRHERIPLGIKMDIVASGNTAAKCRGTIADLSMGGMTFRTNAELEPGMVLHLKLDLPLEIRGEVTSIKGATNGGLHRYGVRFHKIDFTAPDSNKNKPRQFIAAKF